MITVNRFAAAVLTMALAGSLTARPAPAAAVTIVVNGQTVNFDQPPVERAGRVFVPLRGVFEKLGASVVYANGQINAQGAGHSVALHIGSTAAVVDGHSLAMDVAPFLIGARTLVPLRFVAQSLGAGVNYDDSSRTVTIKGNGGGGAPASTGCGLSLQNLSPANGAVIGAKAPVISGDFSTSVDPNSVHVILDGRDITSQSSVYVSATRFQVNLPEIPATSHSVSLKGNCASGQSFDQSFSFTSGSDVSRPFIHNVQVNGVPLVDGGRVPATYTLTGTTIPNARVLIAIGYQVSVLNGLIPIGNNVNTQTVTAGPLGRFTASIDTSTIGNPSQYTIAITATNVATKTQTSVHFSVHS